MGFLNWFSGKPPARPVVTSQTDIHTTLADATRPFKSDKSAKSAGSSAKPATSPSPARVEQRRAERNSRRELLFQVVRESMVRVGILSSAFKFKVLALDQRGRTFLVMIDLSSEFAGETDKLSEVEALIAQSAKSRYELVVQAVYWRFYEAVNTSAARMGAASAPSPLFGVGLHTNSRPAPLSSLPYPASTSFASAQAAADPLEDDEVEAFKRALASGAQPGLSIPMGGNTPVRQDTAVQAVPKAPAPVVVVRVVPQAVNNKLLLTGYEDTEMHDADEPVPALSGTQYGELR
jgi:hypothetical protein